MSALIIFSQPGRRIFITTFSPVGSWATCAWASDAAAKGSFENCLKSFSGVFPSSCLITFSTFS